MLTSAFLIQFAITATFFFFPIPFSTGTNTNYTICSTLYSCGPINNIGYPFWGDNRPEYCGRPEFHLSCYGTRDTPQIYLPLLGPAEVVSINASSHKMTITMDRFFYAHPFCHTQETTNQKLNISTSAAFKLNPSVAENITLFYGCSNSVLKYQTESFACQNPEDGGNGSVLYFSKMSQVIRQEIKSCKNFSVPVLKRELDKLNNGSETLLSVLQKRVEMEYVVNFTACSECQSSGGICGSSDSSSLSEFVCHCPNGPQLLRCPKSGSNKSVFIGLVTAASLLGVVLLIVLVNCSQRRQLLSKSTFPWSKEAIVNQNVEAFLKSYGSLTPKRYTYRDIKKMTNSFKHALGEGGFGHVYKGKLLDGRTVAVKVLKNLKGNGQDFINEVVSISRTNHVNIVTLLGFCFEKTKRALVYEFMANGSLEKFIHGAGSGQPLPCETLFSIAVGIAKGLDYLHRGCNTRILHFDIKPHNILLDEKFRPKISDFGLARLSPKEQSYISSMEARGTIGYIAPEVFCRNFGGVSHKSDVYSFGMMAVDMVCGRTNISAEVQCSSSEFYFPQWIYNQLQVEEKSALQGIADDKENKIKRKMILVSLWCIQTYPSNRPSMNKVVEMLEGSLESLQIPEKPDLSSPLSAFDSSSTSRLIYTSGI